MTKIVVFKFYFLIKIFVLHLCEKVNQSKKFEFLIYEIFELVSLYSIHLNLNFQISKNFINIYSKSPEIS